MEFNNKENEKKRLFEIEFWENEYLEQIAYLITTDKKKMLDGFQTKEDIRPDWEKFLGKETSDFAVGSERIFYWLFNQFGIPNSAPVGSDLFFETYNAYVHIDIKTVTLANIGDFTKNIFVGDNQNSYIGDIEIKGKINRPYKGNLPTFYTKSNGVKKICLTYFLIVLYNEKNLDIQSIVLSCMPNGELQSVYGNKVLAAGKTPGKIRFNYAKNTRFELLDEKYRTKVILWKEDMDKKVRSRLKLLEDLYVMQEKEDNKRSSYE
jgi:hypothetical protein